MERVLINQKEVFEKFGEGYLEYSRYQKNEIKVIRNLIKSECKKLNNQNLKIADLGCGTGQLIKNLSNKLDTYNLEFTGIDFNSDQIQTLQTSLKLSNTKHESKFINLDLNYFKEFEKGLNFIVVQGNTLGNICSGQCLNAVHQSKIRTEFIRSCHTNLVKNGGLFISVYNYKFLNTSSYTGNTEIAIQAGQDLIIKINNINKYAYSHWFTCEEIKIMFEISGFKVTILKELGERIIIFGRKI